MSRRVPGLLAAVAAAALLAGCDSGGTGPTDPTSVALTSAAPTSPSATSSPPPTDGGQLVLDARDALYTDTSSFHVSGTITEYHVDIDMLVASGRITSGTVSYGGGTLEVRQLADGTRYGRGDAEFYADYTVAPDLTGLAGKWVVIGDDAPAPLGFLGDYAGEDSLVFAAGLRPGDDPYRLSGPRDVAGASAYVVTNGKTTWTVAADGPPLPIAITYGGDGTVRFDRYDEPFTVEAPPASQIVAIPTV